MVLEESVNPSSVGDYRCIATRDSVVVAVRNFSVIVDSKPFLQSSEIVVL